MLILLLYISHSLSVLYGVFRSNFSLTLQSARPSQPNGISNRHRSCDISHLTRNQPESRIRGNLLKFKLIRIHTTEEGRTSRSDRSAICRLSLCPVSGSVRDIISTGLCYLGNLSVDSRYQSFRPLFSFFPLSTADSFGSVPVPYSGDRGCNLFLTDCSAAGARCRRILRFNDFDSHSAELLNCHDCRSVIRSSQTIAPNVCHGADASVNADSFRTSVAWSYGYYSNMQCVFHIHLAR